MGIEQRRFFFHTETKNNTQTYLVQKNILFHNTILIACWATSVFSRQSPENKKIT